MAIIAVDPALCRDDARLPTKSFDHHDSRWLILLLLKSRLAEETK